MNFNSTSFAIKEAIYFFENFKKNEHLQEKLYELHASIVFTRAIFHIFNNEVENLKKSYTNNNAFDSIKLRMDNFKKQEWFENIYSLRNLTLKECPLFPEIQPYIEFKDKDLCIKKIKIISQLSSNNKFKVMVRDYDTDEIVELEKNEVDYSLSYEIDGKKIPIISSIELCLEDWKNLLLELEKL